MTDSLLKTERTKLTEVEADALSRLARTAILADSAPPAIACGLLSRTEAAALLSYMSRLEIERNDLRTELTASEKPVPITERVPWCRNCEFPGHNHYPDVLAYRRGYGCDVVDGRRLAECHLSMHVTHWMPLPEDPK